MARSTSILFKFKGTIGELTFVKSRTYKPHVRLKRGTIKPAVLNEKMEASRQLLLSCNKQAKLLFDALRDEPHDGSLWSRLVKTFFHAAASGKVPDVRLFRNLECDVKHPLEPIAGSFQHHNKLQLKQEKKKLTIAIQLKSHPVVPQDPFPGDYRLRVVVVFPDFDNHSYQKEVATGPVTSLKHPLKPVNVQVPVPSAKAAYLVLVSVEAIMKGKPIDLQSMAAMKVVATS
ncbi:hypothetical protein HB364_01795 [Pseudoflavitalea sp. X16]|uniref:hypothetical protein n=1 Tax=Paraflavitalea devenefica TaxID=2716334 RepID=UPI001421EED5|nr:hypothetical protein [Paraflavitalea devenefica]NII23794.1 hypothetical protein [Paraflavitalea devenefica]